MTKIYTSQYNYKGSNRLDVTIKGNDPIGGIYAPTWDMVMGIRKGTLTQDEYTKMYYATMRKRYRENPKKFRSILEKDEVVLVCFEKPEEGFCHRFILANILTKLGGEYNGELNTDGSMWGEVNLENFNEPTK